MAKIKINKKSKGKKLKKSKSEVKSIVCGNKAIDEVVTNIPSTVQDNEPSPDCEHHDDVAFSWYDLCEALDNVDEVDSGPVIAVETIAETIEEIPMEQTVLNAVEIHQPDECEDETGFDVVRKRSRNPAKLTANGRESVHNGRPIDAKHSSNGFNHVKSSTGHFNQKNLNVLNRNANEKPANRSDIRKPRPKKPNEEAKLKANGNKKIANGNFPASSLNTNWRCSTAGISQ